MNTITKLYLNCQQPFITKESEIKRNNDIFLFEAIFKLPMPSPAGL